MGQLPLGRLGTAELFSSLLSVYKSVSLQSSLFHLILFDIPTGQTHRIVQRDKGVGPVCEPQRSPNIISEGKTVKVSEASVFLSHGEVRSELFASLQPGAPDSYTTEDASEKR